MWLQSWAALGAVIFGSVALVQAFRRAWALTVHHKFGWIIHYGLVMVWALLTAASGYEQLKAFAGYHEAVPTTLDWWETLGLAAYCLSTYMRRHDWTDGVPQSMSRPSPDTAAHLHKLEAGAKKNAGSQ
jgi:hypothetical protein